LKTPFNRGLWFRFNPRVETFFGDLTIRASTILSSALDRVTPANPQEGQHCRLVRKRCGVPTLAINCPTWTGPNPGRLERI